MQIMYSCILCSEWLYCVEFCLHCSLVHDLCFVSPNNDTAGRPPQSIYPHKECLLMTTSSAVQRLQTLQSVVGWCVLKPACSAYLHLIYGFMPPTNDTAGRPPQSICPHSACLLMTTNSAVVTRTLHSAVGWC
jgi:hypothetical protein